MILEIFLPDDTQFTMHINGSAGQELASVLRRLTGFESVTSYNTLAQSVTGWKDTQQYEAVHVDDAWRFYPVPDAG